MILEGIVTTLSAAGVLNVAPMGPRVQAGPIEHFLLRPFRTAQTYRNLKAHGEGVLHVTDDVLLLARAGGGGRGPTTSCCGPAPPSGRSNRRRRSSPPRSSAASCWRAPAATTS